MYIHRGVICATFPYINVSCLYRVSSKEPCNVMSDVFTFYYFMNLYCFV